MSQLEETIEQRKLREHRQDLLERARAGKRLNRRDRRHLEMWQSVRVVEELEHICLRLSAPSEIPSEMSDHEH